MTYPGTVLKKYSDGLGVVNIVVVVVLILDVVGSGLLVGSVVSSLNVVYVLVPTVSASVLELQYVLVGVEG